eukprot:TRINITY_DN13678_c0_g1_i1.p1 TRINITY_DN13678_c0_g1~~TRINITY_DN13678_c0_g1_i1.p1  ORF type:complete len:104 (+),score=18.31 TRINITY_DN13678_c0_g1_i1:48-359(+)
MAAEWKQGLCGCFSDMGICCCGCCCNPCLTYQTANDLGKSGLLYMLLGCIMPCIPAMLLRQQARERYNIEGDTGMDVASSVFCTACVTCQTAQEIKERGDSSK